jgi:hypothetical protein
MPEQSEQTEIALLKQEVASLKGSVDDLAAVVKTLSDNWARASGAVAIAKWLAALVVGGGTLAAIVKYKLLGVHS